MINSTVIFADLPLDVKGMVVKTFDEEECFTIVINSRLNNEQQRDAYKHELKHVEYRDFDAAIGVNQIEMTRHAI